MADTCFLLGVVDAQDTFGIIVCQESLIVAWLYDTYCSLLQRVFTSAPCDQQCIPRRTFATHEVQDMWLLKFQSLGPFVRDVPCQNATGRVGQCLGRAGMCRAGQAPRPLTSISQIRPALPFTFVNRAWASPAPQALTFIDRAWASPIPNPSLLSANPSLLLASSVAHSQTHLCNS